MTHDRKKIRIAQHIEVTWTPDEVDSVTCRNCGASGPMPRLLEIDYRPPGKDYAYIVNICAHCGARFFDNFETMDYGTDELIEIGWHSYQVQIGAGLWSISAPLARIDKAAGSRVLEIGGAYGFGLDFAIRGCHWEGVGYDPSPLAIFGADELGLNLKQDYFAEKDLAAGPFDVVLATEVIEHLADPPAFLGLMGRALANDGILLLTTPDGERITGGLDAGALLPILSPGAHLVLQTSASLTLVLQAAGFQHVVIERNGLSLVAYASRSSFLIGNDSVQVRERYRRYLVRRSVHAVSGSDLLLGFAGRGLFESINDADFSAAETAWNILLPACRQRFGIDLETMTALPAAAADASLAELVRIMPLGLGMILYGQAISQLLQGASRTKILPRFRLALAALNALQAALAQRSLTDGLSADLCIAAEREILLCTADAGDPACIRAAADLVRNNARHIVTAWRVFITLVNGGHFNLARELQQTAGLYAPHDEIGQELSWDALFTTGVLALQEPAEWPRAAAIFAQLRRILLQATPAGAKPHHLFWPALRGEVLVLTNLDRRDDSVFLLQQLTAAHEGAPDDLMAQIG